MTWRARAWEFVVSAFSWLLAILALGGLIALVIYDAYKRRKAHR